MATDKIQTGLRLRKSMLDKIKHIATADGRSINNLVESILRQYIENYEREHGEIKVPEGFSR